MWASTRELALRLLNRERSALARAITLIESQRLEHHNQAQRLLDHVVNARQGSSQGLRLGIAGPPGAGKSTLIEALGCHISTSPFILTHRQQ